MLVKYFTVFLGSMFKFIFGPVTGQASGLPMWVTCALTVAGMMTSVIIFAYIGGHLRTFWAARFGNKAKRKPKFTKASRRIVGIWARFGLGGVAFCTPLFFSPIVGTILAVSFGEPPRRIVPFMLVSAVFWGVALTYFFHTMSQLFS